MHILATGQGHHWFKSCLLSPRNYVNSAGPMAIGYLGTNSREIGIKIKHKSWIMRRCIHENYLSVLLMMSSLYNDVIKWKLIPRYWSFLRAIHWSPVDLCGQFTGHRWIPLTTGQWCGFQCFFDVGPITVKQTVNSPVTGGFVRTIHRSPMNSPHNGTVMWISMFRWCGSHNCETNSRMSGDLILHDVHVTSS